MLLHDSPSIKAALATMHPVARSATQLLAYRICESPPLLDQPEALRVEAFESCAVAFMRAGFDLDRDRAKFESFLEYNGANVLDLAVSCVLCMAREEGDKQVWGTVGKVAALVGGIALGAWFG